jgi:hypothetical protein
VLFSQQRCSLSRREFAMIEIKERPAQNWLAPKPAE